MDISTQITWHDRLKFMRYCSY